MTLKKFNEMIDRHEIDPFGEEDWGDEKDDYINGWIQDFDNRKIYYILRKDYQLDKELTFGRGILTDEQNKMVEYGHIIRYDIKKQKIQFMTDRRNNGQNWI